MSRTVNSLKDRVLVGVGLTISFSIIQPRNLNTPPPPATFIQG